MRRPDGAALMCAVMLAVFVAMVAGSLAYGAAARTLPLVIGVPAIALCLIQLALELRRAGAAPRSGGGDPARTAREARLFAWLLAFLACLLAFGLPVGGSLAVSAFLRWHARESWPVSAGGGLLTALLLFGLFEGLLEFELFRGFLGDWWLA